MASRFEELLVDLARQVTATEQLLQAAARREEELHRELGIIREKVAALQKGEEWSGEERRKVDQRLGTGDHTLERLKFEVKEANDNASLALDRSVEAIRASRAVLAKVEEIRQIISKRDARASSRLWFVVKTILQYAIPLIVSGVGTIVTFYFYSKGGRP